MDVRSEIFEEDPCPGTGKYIEAQYYCLGWCTLFFSTDERSSSVDDELTTFSKIRREIPRNVVARIQNYKGFGYAEKVVKTSWRKA